MTVVPFASTPQGWNAFDLELLLQNRRVIAVLDISLGERNLSPQQTGAQVARAFPELRDDVAATAGSILPMQGLGHLTEAEKESLITAARESLYSPTSGYVEQGGRSAWSDNDLDQLLAIPRALAVADVFRGLDAWSLEEMLCRAFPCAYPGGRYRGVIPISGLDRLAIQAVGEIWDAAAAALNDGRCMIPNDMERRFPDVYDLRDIHSLHADITSHVMQLQAD